MWLGLAVDRRYHPRQGCHAHLLHHYDSRHARRRTRSLVASQPGGQAPHGGGRGLHPGGVGGASIGGGGGGGAFHRVGAGVALGARGPALAGGLLSRSCSGAAWCASAGSKPRGRRGCPPAGPQRRRLNLRAAGSPHRHPAPPLPGLECVTCYIIVKSRLTWEFRWGKFPNPVKHVGSMGKTFLTHSHFLF